MPVRRSRRCLFLVPIVAGLSLMASVVMLSDDPAALGVGLAPPPAWVVLFAFIQPRPSPPPPGPPELAEQERKRATKAKTATAPAAAAPVAAAAAPGKPPITAFVMKTFGSMTPWKEWLFYRYHQQLARIGVRLHVVLDISTEGHDNATVHAKNYTVRNVTIPLCEVSMKAARRELRGGVRGQLGCCDVCGVRACLNYIHNVMWWTICDQRRSDYAWFVEPDSFFNGDVANFVEYHLSQSADIVLSGVRVADRTWWLAREFTNVTARGLQTFRRGDYVGETDYPLPSLSDTTCNASKSKHYEGLLFAQDHVNRMSAKYLRLLRAAIVDRFTAPAEGFLATFCASNVSKKYLAPGETPCTLHDFSPLLSRGPGQPGARWVSPMFCWLDWDKWHVSQIGVPCDAAWRQKWLHPVKKKGVGLLGCAL